jgi:hypothetical protein
MQLLNYFDLGLLPDELTLGPKEKAAKARLARQRFWLTLVMYFGVFLGVLGEQFLGLLKANQSLSWSTLFSPRLLIALIVAILIFPQVFPKVFGKMSSTKADGYRHFLQFCIAFQNGFFWQALLLY